MIPAELLEKPNRWTLWTRFKDGDRTKKIPINPHTGRGASIADPTSWAGFEFCRERIRQFSCSGVAYVLQPEDGYVGIDIDDCVHKSGHLNTFARATVARMNTYAEYSQSRTGIHLIAKGQLPVTGRKAPALEMYDRRIFVVTGRHLLSTPMTIESRPGEIAKLHREVFPALYQQLRSKQYDNFYRGNLSDEEVIRRCTTMPKFVRLFRYGNLEEYAGDWSRGELAVVNQIKLFTRNAEQIDRIYRQSALSRDKWDRRTGNTTYGHLTIQRALAGNRSLSR